MSAPRLSQLLSSGGVTPGNVRPLAELCAEWFAAEPGLTTFILRSTFGELDRRWDPQAVPAQEYAPFRDILLPELETLSRLIPVTTEEERSAALGSLVRTFRDCGTAAGWW